MHTSNSMNGSKEPNGDHQPPTDKSYLWNYNIHKNIVEECDQQDCTNWECKLEALAHLLSIAEAKQAIATTYGHLNTRYIKASRHVRQAHEALDRHTQSWAMCMADVNSVINHTGMGQAPANGSGEEPTSTTGVPLPRSTTHQFATHEGTKAYWTQTRSEALLMCAQTVEQRSSAVSQARDSDNEVDRAVNFVSLMVNEAREASKGLSPENSILMRMGAKMPPPEPYSGEPDLERYQVFITGLLRWFLMNQLLGSDAESTLMQLKCLGNCLQGNTQEWYIHNIESWDCTVWTWMLESVLEGLQKHFLHALIHRQVSMSYESTHQGGGTVQDLLNRLTKFTVQMVKCP